MRSSQTSSDNVVIDSNVWISALVFGGSPRKILEYIIRNKQRIVVSQEILTEIRRILQQKFPNFLEDFEALLIAFRQRLLIVPLGSIIITICRDQDDNRVLETAVIGHARTIISGDKDLLVLNAYREIAIMSPSEFIAYINRELD